MDSSHRPVGEGRGSAGDGVFWPGSTGDAPLLVVRELAIDMARSTYTPQIVEHIPGVANVVADVPNYWDALNAMPECHRGATLGVNPPRPRSWWVSLDPP